MTDARPIPPERVDVRPARATDRDAVLAFCQTTWTHGDYIAEVWDEWLSDPRGALLVAVSVPDDHPIGLIHIGLYAETEAWLEGIRVDPAHRRRGAGRLLLSRGLVAARDRGATTARLLTDGGNTAAHGLFERFGFTRVAEVVRYEAPAFHLEPAVGVGESVPDAAPMTDQDEDAPDSSSPPRAWVEDTTAGPSPEQSDLEENAPEEHLRLTIAGAEDADRIWTWLEHSTLSPFNGGLEFLDWHVRALTEAALIAYLDAGRVYLLEEWEMIEAIAVALPVAADSTAPGELEVRYLDGAADWIARLALVLREIAAEEGATTITAWLPDLLILRDAMSGAGYAAQHTGARVVYARAL